MALHAICGTSRPGGAGSQHKSRHIFQAATTISGGKLEQAPGPTIEKSSLIRLPPKAPGGALGGAPILHIRPKPMAAISSYRFIDRALQNRMSGLDSRIPKPADLAGSTGSGARWPLRASAACCIVYFLSFRLDPADLALAVVILGSPPGAGFSIALEPRPRRNCSRCAHVALPWPRAWPAPF